MLALCGLISGWALTSSYTISPALGRQLVLPWQHITACSRRVTWFWRKYTLKIVWYICQALRLRGSSNQIPFVYDYTKLNSYLRKVDFFCNNIANDRTYSVQYFITHCWVLSDLKTKRAWQIKMYEKLFLNVLSFLHMIIKRPGVID